HLADGIENRLVFKGFDTIYRRPLGLERATASSDHHHLGVEYFVRVGRQYERAVILLLDGIDHAVEVEFRRERRDLGHQVVGELLAGDDGEARNIVDRLFRIQLGALPAGTVENVDEMAFDIEQAEFEGCEQPAGARADHDDIGSNFSAHYVSKSMSA